MATITEKVTKERKISAEKRLNSKESLEISQNSINGEEQKIILRSKGYGDNRTSISSIYYAFDDKEQLMKLQDVINEFLEALNGQKVNDENA